MRIVHVINSLATGGAETLVVDLASSMRTAGHDVTILTISDTAGVPLDTARRLGLNVVSLGRSPRDPRAILGLRSHLKTSDLTHVHLFPALYFVPMAGRGRPLVYTEHSTWNKRRDSTLLRRADRFFYKRFASIVAISDGVGNALRSYLASLGLTRDIPVVANGISDTFFDRRRPRSLGEHPRLIAVGNLDERKNFVDAISAVARVPEASLTIVGEGAQRGALERHIADLGVGDRVSLVGQSSDVARLMDQHDVLISTSRFEGFSLVAAEAMAMGLPVVGPDVDGFRDSVVDGSAGILFDQQEGVEGVCRAIADVTRSAATYEALSQGAAENAKRFRASDTARAYLALYEAISETP